MNDKEWARCEFNAEIFKALAHPMRINLLKKIRERPRCVCELAAEAGINKSVASKHLSQLKAAGLIEDEKRGTLVEYHIVTECILDMAECVERTVLARRKKILARM